MKCDTCLSLSLIITDYVGSPSNGFVRLLSPVSTRSISSNVHYGCWCHLQIDCVYHVLAQYYQMLFSETGCLGNFYSRTTGYFFFVSYFRSFTEKPCRSLHTQKNRQIFLQPEPDFWMIMVGGAWLLATIYSYKQHSLPEQKIPKDTFPHIQIPP